ncbi:MAG: glutathione S-transferase [Alteromonadaceae bacterium]|jgi:glutathione S-transferase
MQLLGSTASPFVRRIRLYLLEKNYEFVELDIFSSAGREILTKNNPVQKIPVLIDDDGVCIYDSRVIYRYLANKYNDDALTWPQENQLTLIDAANDALINLLLLSRSQLDSSEDRLFYNLQHERIEQVLNALDQKVEDGEFEQWSYPAICLFCLLDWIDFRALYNVKNYVHLVAFKQVVLNKKGTKETAPY